MGWETQINPHSREVFLALFHPSFNSSTFSGCRVSILPASSSSRHWRPQRPAASASCGRLYGAYRRFQWRWGRSLLLCLQPPAWIPLWRRDTWTETEQTQGYVSFLSTSPPLPLSMNAWSDCHAQWSPLLSQPAPTDDDCCKLHNINREPQPHEITGQDTVRHTTHRAPRWH